MGLVLGLFSCCADDPSDSPKKLKKTDANLREIRIDPKVPCKLCKSGRAPGFVLWLSQNAEFAALVLFNEDSNHDGKVEPKFGEHGELLADRGQIAWVNLASNETQLYDAFLGSDPLNRWALLKKDNAIFAVNTGSGQELPLPGASSKKDRSNPCLPSREAVLSNDGKRVVYPTGPQNYRSLELSTRVFSDFQTESLLWRVRPTGASEEVFEIVKDRDGDGLKFPKSQSTCACDWCPRFARSVGSYGSVGDEISKSVYEGGKKRAQTKSFKGCKEIGKGESDFVLLECGFSIFRGNRLSGEKKKVAYKLKIPSYENPTIDGWFPVLSLGEKGLKMGRYNVETNTLEGGPSVNRYAKKTHSSGFWLGRSGEENIVWSLQTNRFQSIDMTERVTTMDGLVFNTSEGKYIVDGFTGATAKIKEEPTWTTQNGCALFRAQTHRIRSGPWTLTCASQRKNR